MLKQKLKALLTLRGTSISELAKHNNVSLQHQSNKIRNHAYKITDLIQLADFTNTKLAFIDENNNPVIVFDPNDIEDKNKSNE